MAQIKSQKKRILTDKKRYDHNKAIRSTVRTAVKKAKTAIVNGSDDVKELLNKAFKEIDSAVSKNVYHKNTGARQKSNLMNFYNTSQKQK